MRRLEIHPQFLFGCFNPRPAPRSGAIRWRGIDHRLAVVSIRAPLRGAGRYAAHATPPPAAVFQSAPRSEERGDMRSTMRPVMES